MDQDEYDWTEMSADEKADHIRDEFNRLTRFVNGLSRRVGKLAERVDRLEAGKG